MECTKPDFGRPNIRSRSKRFKSLFVPPIPADVSEVVINDNWSETWSGKKFLRYQDNNLGILVFMTKKIIKALPHCRHLFIDGTFKTAPHPYFQMVTIHGFLHGCTIPLCFCLLTGKTTPHYIYSSSSNAGSS
jgi:hypothetical protein